MAFLRTKSGFTASWTLLGINCVRKVNGNKSEIAIYYISWPNAWLESEIQQFCVFRDIRQLSGTVLALQGEGQRIDSCFRQIFFSLSFAIKNVNF